MGILKSIGKGIGHIFDFRVDRWLNIKLIKDQTLFLINETRELFKVEKPTYSEDYDEAIERLELSPEFLAKQQRKYFYLAVLYSIASVLLLIYGLYIFFLANLMGTCICLGLAFFSITYAFRYHFWYFQIKQKKLGCSVQEWFKYFHVSLFKFK